MNCRHSPFCLCLYSTEHQLMTLLVLIWLTDRKCCQWDSFKYNSTKCLSLQQEITLQRQGTTVFKHIFSLPMRERERERVLSSILSNAVFNKSKSHVYMKNSQTVKRKINFRMFSWGYKSNEHFSHQILFLKYEFGVWPPRKVVNNPEIANAVGAR